MTNTIVIMPDGRNCWKYIKRRVNDELLRTNRRGLFLIITLPQHTLDIAAYLNAYPKDVTVEKIDEANGHIEVKK